LNAKPVTVGGVRYPSISAAARAFGMDHSVVISRLREGWPLRRALTVKPRSRGQGITVTIRGCEYPSLWAACKALGAPYSASTRRLKQGWDPERAVSAPVGERGGPAKNSGKRLHAAGKRYPSITAAAKAIGVDPSVVRERIRAGWTPSEALSAPVRATLTGRPVTVAGRRYPSIAAAARAHGLTSRLAQDRVYKGWALRDAVTVPAGEAYPAIPVTFHGRRFESLETAAATTGVNLKRLNTLRRSGMSAPRALDELVECEDARKTLLKRRERFKARGPEQGFPGPGGVELRGVRYTTVAEISRTFHLPAVTIRSRLRHGWTVEQAVGIEARPKLVRNIVGVKVNGEDFPNMSAAARRFGVPWHRARYRLQIGATAEQAFGLEHFEPRHTVTGRPITVAGETFPSLEAACRKILKRPGQIVYRLKRGETPEQAFDLEPPPKDSAAVVIAGRPFRFLSQAARYYKVPAARLHRLIAKGVEPTEAVRIARTKPQDGRKAPRRGALMRRGSSAVPGVMPDGNAQQARIDFAAAGASIGAILSMPIEELTLTTRSFNCLRAHDIYSLEDLVQCTEVQLLTLPNLGRKSFAEITEAVARLGLRIGVRIPEGSPTGQEGERSGA
jgi:hypothetical protein